MMFIIMVNVFIEPKYNNKYTDHISALVTVLYSVWRLLYIHWLILCAKVGCITNAQVWENYRYHTSKSCHNRIFFKKEERKKKSSSMNSSELLKGQYMVAGARCARIAWSHIHSLWGKPGVTRERHARGLAWPPQLERTPYFRWNHADGQQF